MTSRYALPDLPYDFQSLEPFIDTTTMHLHHDKHHATYVSKLNDAIAKLADDDKKARLATSDIVEVQRHADDLPVAIRNNGGGHYNHSLFWKWMAPVGTSNVRPAPDLLAAVDTTFGSLDAMRQQFNDAAATRFGSGWAWLCVDAQHPSGDSKQSLHIVSTPNQDNPLMWKDKSLIPILGLDVWEHAYYLKYQNRRAEYIERWWNVVNWDFVSRCYDDYAIKGKAVEL